MVEAPGPVVALDQDGVRLTLREAQVLTYLTSYHDRPVSGPELVTAIWNDHAVPSAPRYVISRLRAKFPGLIETVRPYGWMLRDEIAHLARELVFMCSVCGRARADYGNEGWICYGCGASGGLPPVHERRAGAYLCAYCGAEVQRHPRHIRYEAQRNPGGRLFCSRRCAARGGRRK